MRNRFFIAVFIALVAAGCSNTKYLPEGELLYTGGKVKVEDSLIPRKQRKALAKEFQGLLRPRPNKTILGLRPKLYAYNIAGEPKKEKGFRHWLRTKVGEPPVLFSQVDLQYNADVLQSYSENHGYFKTRTASDSTRHGKKATAEYIVKPGRQYKIRNVVFPEDSSKISMAIARTQKRSALKSGEGYDLDKIRAERERIDARLKEKGFYYFGPDYLKVQVDSTVGKYLVDMKVVVKPETPPAALEVYKIDKITIYPNFSIKTDTINYKKDDVIEHNDFTIIDSAKTFNPRIFDRTLLFKTGDIYNRKDHNQSLSRLINMGTFKFVKNEFKRSELANTLDAYYYLTPLPKKSIRVETLAKTNSANYTGSEVNVSWSNRNAFRSAELLTVSAFGGMEFQVSGQNKGYNVYRLGSEVNLIWPRWILPFKVHTPSEFVPRTKATIGYEFQKRIKLYALNSFKGSFGYLWKEDIYREHELNVTQINYVSPNGVSEEYMQKMAADPTGTLAKVIEKQLIFGPTYSYTFTNTMRKRKVNTFYYKGSLELAGTLAGLITGANVKQGDTVRLFNVPFSQYAKTEQDFRHYFKLNDRTTLASRIIVGVGYPYGNSTELPFIKQFFIGGTNSIRAFRARSIGPGTYYPEDTTTFFPDQSGDIKLELNTELRAKLFSVVNGAIFVDAGNIWLMNKDENRPGAEFSGKFLNELAVGTGVGLRFDLSFLVLRTDLAFPLRKPYLPEGQRWVFDQIDFGSRSWRKENLVFNLAIGYPF
ncbi:MAG: hypothetical protein EOO48_00735 [Flavobacterium sp.]|nr:MAG: hypothetical protein EOO48_00735 [Flavobacterium sp.]